MNFSRLTPLATAAVALASGSVPGAVAAPATGSSARERIPTASVAPERATSHIARRADSPERASDQAVGGPTGSRAPTAPPLLGSSIAGGGDEPQIGGSPAAEADPLVRNGLASPLCNDALGGPDLSAGSRHNCETSEFIGAAAPTGNFGLDVHIDTGFLGLSSAQLLVIVQNLLVAPVWMALVWAVHALVVMLEWCFSLDLLDRGTLRGGVASSLRGMQSAITVPWLALVLAVGACLCVYHGIVRRRVAESLAQALLALSMTAMGMWLTLDPAGTVGTLAAWANQASVGTLAVSARGTPANPGAKLAEGFESLFVTAIEVPWCYLEFGDVNWCSSPRRLDPGLRSAALALARSESSDAGCSGQSTTACAASGEAGAGALERSAHMLRAARNNGAIFLALPPNGPARNSINDQGSLLRAICRNDNATDCRGSAAPEAEFRTNRGTWPRVGGLLLIGAGVLGLLLLLGFIAVRLLGAALFSLLYLLLAPAVALAPALGETGRSAFRKWATSLLAAVLSKLLYAFLLGVVLALLALLGRLQALGWWTRWLLLSAFWWGTFLRRHQLLQMAGVEHSSAGSGTGAFTWRRVRSFGAPGPSLDRVRAARERFRSRAPALDVPRATVASGSPGSAAGGDRHPPAEEAQAGEIAAVARVPRAPTVAASEAPATEHRSERSPRARDELAAHREHLVDQRDRAHAVGSSRRAIRLGVRLAQRDRDDPADFGRESRALSMRDDSRERVARYERFLDAQARLPAFAKRTGAEVGRSYGALAGLAGYGSREYRRLDDAAQRTARTQVDRALAARREAVASRRLAGTSRGADWHEPLRPSDRAKAGEEVESMPLIPARFDPRGIRPRPASPGRSESRVMREARGIAARRRRQLGEPER